MDAALRALIKFAAEKSPFYRALYQDLNLQTTELKDLPIPDSKEFWSSLKENRLLTDLSSRGGYVFKSGGTTGSAKFSHFTFKEWEKFTESFGWGMAEGKGIEDGDRVANLFYAGDLYASFIFINDSIKASARDVKVYPFTGNTDFAELVRLIQDFGINTLAGVPTTIMSFAEYVKINGISIQIEKILFGGESFFPEQRKYIQAVWSKCEVRSIGCASVDGGLIGFADTSCAPEEHRSFPSDLAVTEIIGVETGLPIQEKGQKGRLVITQLTRELMPMIRYPVGDLAEWTDDQIESRKFRLCGRSEEAARVGPVSFYFEDLKEILVKSQIPVTHFQIKLERDKLKDQMTLKMVSPESSAAVKLRIQEIIYNSRPLLRSAVLNEKILPIKIDFTNISNLETNTRTGKIKRVIDLRY